MCSFRMVLLVLFMFSFDALAQEATPSAEELLRFFPMGDYEEINHAEIAALKASKFYDAYLQFSGIGWTRKNQPMPEELIDAAESVTHARKVKVYVFLWKPGETKFGQRGRGSRGTMVNVGGTTYAAEGVGEELYVLRFLDLPAVLKNFSEAGVIADTGETLGGLAIYTAQKKGLRGADYTLQMVVLETGELLAAENKATLKRMLDTAQGQEVSVLGDPTYLTFEEALQYPGQSFRWGTHQHMKNAVFKYAEKRGDDSADIEAAREKDRKHFFEYDVRVWDISGPAVERVIFAYASEDIARERMSRRTGPVPAGVKMNEYSLAVREVQKHSVDGAKLITTTTYDDDTIKKLTEAREKDKKEYEQQKKEEKEKADEKK